MKLLGTKEKTTKLDHRVFEMGPRLTQHHAKELSKEITGEEIKKTLFSIGDDNDRIEIMIGGE